MGQTDKAEERDTRSCYPLMVPSLDPQISLTDPDNSRWRLAAIKTKLRRNFLGFERFDEQSHEAATDLAKRTPGRNIARAAKTFGYLAHWRTAWTGELRTVDAGTLEMQQARG
jgi:hypothetical protein